MNYFFKGFKRGFKEFGQNTSRIVNTALLSVVYIIGIGIPSIIAKIFRKKFLEKDLLKEDTYYSDLNLEKKSKEEYLRQF